MSRFCIRLHVLLSTIAAAIGAQTSTPDALLNASDPAAGDWFGFSVAISGDLAVVGSRMDDDGCPSTDCDTGSAYIFARPRGSSTGWVEAKKLHAFDAAEDDWFGAAVAIDGATVVVAADGSDVAGVDSGAVYIFERDQGGPDQWGFVKQLVGSAVGVDDRFGADLALQGDLLAATSGSGTYVFERNLGSPENWGERTVVEGGGSVAVSGDTMVIGRALVDDACPMEDPDCDAGAVRVLGRNVDGPDVWGELKTVVAPDPAAGARFGWSVSLDGDTLVVGAVFDPQIAFNAGAGYIFERNLGGPSNWGFSKKILGTNTEESDWFGSTVAVLADQVAVGARFGNCLAGVDTGAVYLFTRNEGAPESWGQDRMLCPSVPEDGDLLGAELLGITRDTLIAGARQDDENCGPPPHPDCNTGSALTFSLPVFTNGFESGDTSRWSVAVPKT